MFFVLPKRENPIICRSKAISGSESISISFFNEGDSAGAVVVELSVALVEGSRDGRELGVFVPLGAGDEDFGALDAADEPAAIAFDGERVGLEGDAT